MPNSQNQLGPVGKRLKEKLQAALNPISLEVIDDSQSHAGHAGNPGGDRESHFHVNITSPAFDGKNRLARQRLVNDAVKEDVLSGAVHAFSMSLKGSQE